MATNAANSSPHTPLSDPSHIRLVRLRAGGFLDPVRCDLEHCSLDGQDLGHYVTLSYRPEGSNAMMSIFVDGRVHLVNETLYFFLKHAQKLLLTVAKICPNPLRDGEPVLNKFTQELVLNLLRDPKFPPDFPDTPEEVIRPFVQLHVDQLIQKYTSRGSTWMADTIRMATPLGSLENCYLRLWVDVLSVNQHDTGERNRQAGHMKRIQKEASDMFIWPLGPAMRTPGINAFITHSHVIRAAMVQYYTSVNAGAATMTEADALASCGLTTGDFRHIEEVLGLKWFSDIWSIPGVAHNKNPIILFGCQPMLWDFLTSLVLPYCNRAAATTYGVKHYDEARFRAATRNFVGIRNLATEYQANSQAVLGTPPHSPGSGPSRAVANSLSAHLRSTTGAFEASDPRDLFYALLGLLSTDEVPPSLQPNYSLTLKQVVFRFTSYIATATGDLSFLAFRRGGAQDSLPTWLPDWRHLVGELAVSAARLPYQTVMNPTVSPDGQRLEVDGALLGRISYAPDLSDLPYVMADVERMYNTNPRHGHAELPDSGHTIAEVISAIYYLRHIQAKCEAHLASYTPSFSQPFFASCWRRLWPGFDHPDSQSVYDFVTGQGKSGLGDIADISEDICNRAEFRALKQLVCVIRDRGLFVLEGGYKMVVPCRDDVRPQIGDVVCMLSGIGIPCILRPYGGGHHYAFVSACEFNSFEPADYANDVMHLRSRVVLV